MPAEPERLGVVFPCIIDCDALLGMLAAFGEFAKVEPGGPLGVVGLKGKCHIALPFRQVGQLVGQRARGRVLANSALVSPKSPKSREVVELLADILAQGAGPGVCVPHLRRAGPNDRHEPDAETELHREFLPRPLGRLGQVLEKLQSLGQVTDRLAVRRALDGALTGSPPIVHRLLGKTRFGVVVGEALELFG